MTSSLVLQEGEVQEKVGQVCRAVRQALELQDNTEYKQGKTFFLPDSSCRGFLCLTSVISNFAYPYPHQFRKPNPRFRCSKWSH
jgi:hypothetical protein